ncbi:MAG: HD domain-containing protein, partial [Bryobacteraceae bacterium]|nr:HD domain-containing protein [Bryobacteraceae bacterium]
AAYLHDVGHFVSDVGHHKHSHYLVSNSDMPGFTAWERKMTALLCRYHRKSLPAPRHDIFQALTPEERQTVMRLTPMLRLADGLDRSHDQRVEGIACQMRNGGVTVKVESAVDTDLEMWAAERVAELFEQVFALQLTITRARKQT